MWTVSAWGQASLEQTVTEQEADEWGDDWATETSPWSHSGFMELAWGERSGDDVLFDDQTPLGELRWHQALEYTHDKFDFNWSHDFWMDEVAGQLMFDLRALNIDFSLFGQTDVVLGRQITTWGTGDLLFINDPFPKDWVSFFSGRDDNYLKSPADALRLTSYFNAFNVDLVITPEAEPDRFINGERFSLFSPFEQRQVGGFEVVNPRHPRQTEYALRLFRNFKGHQLALYAYHGIEKSPNGVDNTLQPYFAAKNVWGASLQSAIGQGLYHVELGYHDALDDKSGINPMVANAQWRLLLGYERELIKKLNWGWQYYVEHTEHYERLIQHAFYPQTEIAENRQVMTNRFTYLTMQDKLTWSLFVFYSPTDDDSYWRPSVNYRHNDQWQFTAGAQIFTGQKSHTFFGQFEDASALYTRIRFQF
ncbi:hypothetical protein [Marinicella litoralis]|uniref:Uncharacterized protein n=2 Tax=Marinicella litoralis TaxID=644220 RepID=A0A4R6XRK1_9GAMM|nr:hypothetical protein [Marinicella litoralis]TDR22356.1 hypothetical protein C8D91_0844 [Marinicella litoralis]